MDLPKKFTDELNRSWVIDINVGTLKRIKAHTGIVLDDLIGTVKASARTANRAEAERLAREAQQPLRDLMDDTSRFMDLLYAILQPDAAKANPPISQDDFDAGFRGPTIAAAHAPFLQALHDFFPQAPKKALTRGLIEEMRAMRLTGEAGLKRIEEMASKMSDAEVTRIANQEMDAAMSEEPSSKSASDSPATSGLTLAG